MGTTHAGTVDAADTGGTRWPGLVGRRCCPSRIVDIDGTPGPADAST